MIRLTLIMGALGLLIGCSPEKDNRSPEQVWRQVCATCHGLSGEGLRHKLGKSIDMRTEKWQDEHSDDEIRSIIENGKRDRKRMPAFKKQLSEEQIVGLVEYLRVEIGKRPPTAGE